MANQVVKIASKPGRTSPTIKLFAEYGDTEVDSESATPGTNDPSLYSATFVDITPGRYRVVIIEGSTVKGVDYVTLKATAGDYPCDGLRKPEFLGDTVRKTKVAASSTVLDETLSEVV